MKRIMKRVAAALFSAAAMAMVCSGVAFAENIAEADVDVTTLTPATNGDHENDMISYGSGKYDAEITYSLQAMVDSGQVKSELPDSDLKIYFIDLDGDGNQDIMYGAVFSGDDLASATTISPLIAILGTRNLTGNYSITLSDASKAKALGSYAEKLNFKFPPAHEHKWATTWKYDKTAHWHPCDNPVCSAAIEKKSGYAAHTFGLWTVTTKATDSADGSKERTCSVCGYKQTEVIPKGTKGDQSGNPTTTPGGDDTKLDSKDPGQGGDTTTAEAATLTVKASKNSAKKGQKKNQTIKLNVTTNSKGKVSYKVACKSAKLKKCVKVSKKGVITIKKKAPKGSFKVTVTVAANGTMKSISKTITIKVK